MAKEDKPPVGTIVPTGPTRGSEGTVNKVEPQGLPMVRFPFGGIEITEPLFAGGESGGAVGSGRPVGAFGLGSTVSMEA